MAAFTAPEAQFSSSEVNLLIYHYLKESGFLHTCFSLRHEARLDDLPAAHEAVVHPGQLLEYLQRGLLYATAERHVQARADGLVPPPPDPLIAPPDTIKPPSQAGSARQGLTPPPVAMTPAKRLQNAASQTPEVHEADELAPRTQDDDVTMDESPSRKQAEDTKEDSSPRHQKKTKRGPRPSIPPRSGSVPASAKAKSSPGPAPTPDKNVLLLAGHSAEVFVTAWNPTVPSLLASGAGDATVRIWDLDTPDEPPAVCKHLPPTQAKNISNVVWNPDGTLLASGSYDGILRLWTPQGDLHLVMSMHQGAIFAVRWHAKGNFLLTGSADGTAIVWDVGSGRTRQQFSLHSDNVLDVQWLTGGLDMPSTSPAVAHPDPAVASSVFATCSADNSVHLCKLGEAKPVKTFHGHTDEVNAIRFDPSQTLLASASDDTTARIWAVGVPGVAAPTGLAPHAVSEAATSDTRPLLTLKGHTKELYALAWCPTGPHSAHPDQPRMLATCSFDKTARLWNGDTGECLRVLDGHDQSVYALCFSPCARFLATGGVDGKAILTSLKDGNTLYQYEAGGAVLDLAWKASTGTDGAQLAVAQADKHVGVLNVAPLLNV